MGANHNGQSKSNQVAIVSDHYMRNDYPIEPATAGKRFYQLILLWEGVFVIALSARDALLDT
jgi:hypothetical protein